MTKLAQKLKLLDYRNRRLRIGLARKDSPIKVAVRKDDFAMYQQQQTEHQAARQRSERVKKGWLKRKGLSEPALRHTDRTLPVVIPAQVGVPAKPTFVLTDMTFQYAAHPHTKSTNTVFVKLTANHKSLTLERFGFDGRFLTGNLVGQSGRVMMGIEGKRVSLLGVSCFGKLVPIRKACRCTPQMAAAVEQSIAWQKGLTK